MPILRLYRKILAINMIEILFFLVYIKAMASKTSTTIRIDQQLKRMIMKIAREQGLSFSQVASIALKAIADGVMHISVGVSKYPEWYLNELDKESEEMTKQYEAGKLKTYSSSKELFDDILER